MIQSTKSYQAKMRIAPCKPELDNETQSHLIDEITALTMDLECSGVIDVTIPSLTQAPDLRHEEEVEETTYKLPQVHIELVQMHPEYLKTSEPQMMIEMCCLTHNHIAFKGTLAPGLRAASERSEVFTDGQSWPSTHDLSLELPD